MSMTVTPYTDADAREWNAAVDTARNATFLFRREYMDYHRDRFADASLLFRDVSGRIVGLLPATRHAEGHMVSHGGLTYGGLLLQPAVRLAEVGEMFRLAARYYQEHGSERMIYKPIPAIYHRYPADDDLYWLFRAEARLTGRTASTALRLDTPLSVALWHRKMKKRAAEGLRIEQVAPERLPEFWDIVDYVLTTRHATHPVHTAAEMQLLMHRCPQSIAFYAALDETDCILAGTVAFVTDRCFHIQYMESSDEGKRRRALDLLIHRLIDKARRQGLAYFDFGISTECGGRVLNEGLVYQKEGFGGRTVCYDIYEVDLDRMTHFDLAR